MRKKQSFVEYVLLYAVFFILSSYIVTYADDFVFKAGIERYGSFFGWVAFFARNWGGRIVPQGILVLLLQLPPFVFHVIDAFAWVILLAYTKKIFDIDESLPAVIVYGTVFFLVFALIPRSVLNGSVFWKCANVLYLWGSAAVLIAIYPFFLELNDIKITRRDYLLSFAAAFYASSFEQAGGFLCGASLLLLLFVLYERRRVQRLTILLLLFTVISTVFFNTLPGNTVRFHAEVLGWMPKYDMYSTLDKALWGVWYVIDSLEHDVIFLVLLLSGTVTVVMFMTRKPTDVILIGAELMFCYFLLCTLNQIGISETGTTGFLSKLFGLIQIDTTEFYFSKRLAVKSIIHFMAYIYLGCCIMLIHPHQFNPVGFVFYFGALATAWVMGFSPTIYASGPRARFICYLFLICVEIQILSYAASHLRNSKRSCQNQVGVV